MELWKTIKAAELSLFGMRGKGLGAILLTVIILSVILIGKDHDDFLTRIASFVASLPYAQGT